MGLNENGSNMVMPVGPAYGSGNGGFGNNDWWILLFLFALWGNNGWGGNGANGAGGVLPYFTAQNTDASVQRGFDQAAVIGQLEGIQNSITNGFASAEVANCNRAMNGLERSFNAQTALSQQLNGIQGQIAQTGAVAQLATCQTQNAILSEGSATRTADLINTRDIIDNDNRNHQAIMDKLCQLELDGVKAQLAAKDDIIAQLRTDLNMAALKESQTAQNAFIAQGLNNEVDQLYNRLSNCPVPSTPVYGRTPIFTCNGQGCGCNGSF